jgi:nitrogen regulatory protein P-II 1
MKKIEAIIREDRFYLVKIGLEEKGFTSMTVSEVMGRGRQRGVALKWRIGEHRVEFLPKKKIEMVVNDQEVETVIETICERGGTGKMGDGKIFVIPVEKVIRIRDKEQGANAV